MGEYDRLEEYLGLLEQDLDHVNQLIETGNVNLDAILNSKISLAQKNGIEIDYQAKCSETFAVSDIDLCALIGNLLDNAVESCEKLTTEKPFIRCKSLGKSRGEKVWSEGCTFSFQPFVYWRYRWCTEDDLPCTFCVKVQKADRV